MNKGYGGMVTFIYKGGEHQGAGVMGMGTTHCRIEVVTILINNNHKFRTSMCSYKQGTEELCEYGKCFLSNSKQSKTLPTNKFLRL